MLERGGAEQYFGEPVTQLVHALQTAALAVAAGATDALVVAALLHDIGHLMAVDVEAIPELEVDGAHEEIGYRCLQEYFGPDVTEPVRLHVAAKRYLCATQTGYEAALSPASQQSLQLQGGPMTAEEIDAFERTPWAMDAAKLRRWDDGAKTPGLQVPGLAAYRDHLQRVLASR